MPATQRKYCIDPRIGRFLEDAKSDALLQPGREEDRRLFWQKHFVNCPACRAAILDHANETVTFPLLQEIASRKGIPIEEVLERFQQQVRGVARNAGQRGLSFREVLKSMFDS